MEAHPSDSIADVSARLALWAEDEGGGLGRVEFVDERARLAVMAFLRRELENKGHQVCEIRCPGGLPPNQLAQWLVEELGKLDQPATLISIENLAAAVEEQDLQLLLATLNFRREQLDPHSSRQIWWVPSHLATAFAHLIPDLDSFFQLKLRLRESSWEPLPNLLFSSLAEAEPLMRRSLASDETSFGPDHPNVAVDLNDLAELLKDMHRFAEAESLIRRALAIDQASFGQDHPNVARDLNNLALLLQATNRLAEAEPLLRRALVIDETSFGPDHPNVSRDLNNLALLLKDMNRFAEAEPLLRRALAIAETSFGPEHPMVATPLNNLAILLFPMHRLAEAEPLLRRALAIDETRFGPDHPNVARHLNNLAGLLPVTEAEPLMRRALTIDETSFGPDHPDVARDLNNLARLLRATSRLAEAEPLLRRALAIFERSLGPDHPRTVAARGRLDSAETIRVAGEPAP